MHDFQSRLPQNGEKLCIISESHGPQQGTKSNIVCLDGWKWKTDWQIHYGKSKNEQGNYDLNTHGIVSLSLARSVKIIMFQGGYLLLILHPQNGMLKKRGCTSFSV